VTAKTTPMTAAVSLPLAVWAAHPATAYVVLSLAMAVLILARHKNNIRRLRAGTEPRLGERSALKPPASAEPLNQ